MYMTSALDNFVTHTFIKNTTKHISTTVQNVISNYINSILEDYVIHESTINTICVSTIV